MPVVKNNCFNRRSNIECFQTFLNNQLFLFETQKNIFRKNYLL